MVLLLCVLPPPVIYVRAVVRLSTPFDPDGLHSTRRPTLRFCSAAICHPLLIPLSTVAFPHSSPFTFSGLYDDIDAVLDLPTAFFPAELLAAYPTAKFISTERDVDEWFTSISGLTDVSTRAGTATGRACGHGWSSAGSVDAGQSDCSHSHSHSLS